MLLGLLIVVIQIGLVLVDPVLFYRGGVQATTASAAGMDRMLSADRRLLHQHLHRAHVRHRHHPLLLRPAMRKEGFDIEWMMQAAGLTPPAPHRAAAPQPRLPSRRALEPRWPRAPEPPLSNQGARMNEPCTRRPGRDSGPHSPALSLALPGLSGHLVRSHRRGAGAGLRRRSGCCVVELGGRALRLFRHGTGIWWLSSSSPPSLWRCPSFWRLTALAAAAMNHAVSRAYLGEKTTIREAYKTVWRRGWRYIGLFLLEALIVWVAPIAVWIALVLLAAGVAALAQIGRHGRRGRRRALRPRSDSGRCSTGWLLHLDAAPALSGLSRLRRGADRRLAPRSSAASRSANGTKGRIFLLYLLVAVLGWLLSMAITVPVDAFVIALLPGSKQPETRANRRHGDAASSSTEPPLLSRRSSGRSTASRSCSSTTTSAFAKRASTSSG